MLIKRQRCKEFINLSVVESIYTNGSAVLARYASGENIVLGSYRSRNRAIEVLQEIVEAYKAPAVEVNVSAFIIRSDTSVVYEMPEA